MATNTPIEPPQGDLNASDMIRQKVAQAYTGEPDAAVELAEAEAVEHRSKHQQFMYELSTSGKDLATIQTQWHNYYQRLPAHEKHKVWQEFYSSQAEVTGQALVTSDPAQAVTHHKHQAAGSDRTKRTGRASKLRDVRSKEELQAAIRHKVTAGGNLKAKHHLQSLLFGFGMGSIVLVIFLFGFFNEVIIAPFIQPSRVTAATPLIVNQDSVAPSETPEVIIPKINVQIPVDYTQATIDEPVLEAALDHGVIHYPTTTKPGQTGNTALFGHSSNNIFNKGKYKFAFVLLHNLVEDDTFYLTYEKKVYVYKVISKQVVDPSNVSVLNPVAGKTATATLITCDPPGTSLHRLVVVGEQVSPDPTGNAAAAATAVSPGPTSSNPDNLLGNGPTLLGRFARSAAGKLIIFLIIIGGIVTIARWINRRVVPRFA